MPVKAGACGRARTGCCSVRAKSANNVLIGGVTLFGTPASQTARQGACLPVLAGRMAQARSPVRGTGRQAACTVRLGRWPGRIRLCGIGLKRAPNTFCLCSRTAGRAAGGRAVTPGNGAVGMCFAKWCLLRRRRGGNRSGPVPAVGGGVRSNDCIMKTLDVFCRIERERQPGYTGLRARYRRAVPPCLRDGRITARGRKEQTWARIFLLSATSLLPRYT